jgi:Tol biopolymer transport system component
MMGLNRIVFTRFQGNSEKVFNDLYSIDPDGNNELRLTANPGADGVYTDNAAPRYNKDKTLLAFLSTKNNDNNFYNIFFLDLANKKTAQITSGNLDMSSVDWAPDDSRLVFSCRDNAGTQQAHLVKLDGSGFTQLTKGPLENVNPRWSPQGGLIAFTQLPREGKTSQICIMDEKGGDLEQLTADETRHSNPSWSPDGSWLVYQCDLGKPHLRKINVRTREVVVFKAPASGADASPVWSGTEIVFSSNRDWDGADSLFNLYRMSDNGENIQRLTNNQTYEYCGDW